VSASGKRMQKSPLCLAKAWVPATVSGTDGVPYRARAPRHGASGFGRSWQMWYNRFAYKPGKPHMEPASRRRGNGIDTREGNGGRWIWSAVARGEVSLGTAPVCRIARCLRLARCRPGPEGGYRPDIDRRTRNSPNFDGLAQPCTHHHPATDPHTGATCPVDRFAHTHQPAAQRHTCANCTARCGNGHRDARSPGV